MALTRNAIFERVRAFGHCTEEDIAREQAGKEEEWTNMFVFAVLLSWARGADETLEPEEEYATLKSRLGQGNGLFVGCSEGALGGVRYDAVIVLRGGIATCGELQNWIVVNVDGTPVELSILEPGSGVRLEDFLGSAQNYCERGGERYGERIEMRRGDAETMSMVQMERSKGRVKSGNELKRALERLNGRMETLKKSDEELISVLE